MIPLPLHLSHAPDAADGGIATAVAALISAQQACSLTPAWITANHFPAYKRDRALRGAVLAAAPRVVHLHGLWRSSTRIAAPLNNAGLPLVISPHGMLDPGALAISRRKKQLVWHLWERRALDSARCLHALCASEVSAIRGLLPHAPIALIPNGVTLPAPRPEAAEPLPASPWHGLIPDDASVLLYFGRFHSKKGFESLLEAWEHVSQDALRHHWWLALVGYGDGGSLDRQVAAAQARGELRRVSVYGPVFGAAKQAVLAGASAFVLPSHSEGLPMAALEAMAYQLPCLLSSACNLPEAFRAGAALAAEPVPAPLADSLRQLFALSATGRAAMGAAGQALVQEHFCWPVVAEQTRDLYRWILGGGERPGFVELG